jgi:hypothetical protein
MMVLSPILKKMLIGRAFSNEHGRIKLYGKMDWMMFPARALAMNFQSIAEKSGPEYLRKLGRVAGTDANHEILACTSMKEGGGWVTQKVIIALLDFIGFGQTRFIKTDLKEDGHHHFKMHLMNNPVIEHAVKLYGKKSMVCQWFMGVYEAHGELGLGLKNCKITETQCIKDGFPHCEWESKW